MTTDKFSILVPQVLTSDIITTDADATAATLWTAGTYATGVQRYLDMILYEVSSNVSNTTNQPPHADWNVVEYINPYKCFDGAQGSQTTKAASPLTVTVTPAIACNGAAVINVDATRVTVTVTDDIEGEVYSKTEELLEDVTNWWEYFFLEYSEKTDAIFTDLPSYPGADITLEVERDGAGAVLVGEFVVGQLKPIGYTQFGASAGIVDYSRKVADEFGTYTIEERTFSERASFDLQIETSDLSIVKRFLTKIRATPCVFVGDPTQDALVVYGFFRDFDVVLSSPTISECSITVESI